MVVVAWWKGPATRQVATEAPATRVRAYCLKGHVGGRALTASTAARCSRCMQPSTKALAGALVQQHGLDRDLQPDDSGAGVDQLDRPVVVSSGTIT